jgi:hypothetical protein
LRTALNEQEEEEGNLRFLRGWATNHMLPPPPPSSSDFGLLDIFHFFLGIFLGTIFITPIYTARPPSPNEILFKKEREEIFRILDKEDANDSERLYLTCFLKEKVGWNETQVVDFIYCYNKWDNFDLATTRRQVRIIFDKVRLGQLGVRFLESRRNSAGGESRLMAKPSPAAIPKKLQISPSEFRNSKEKGVKMQEKRVIAKANNGSRFYKLAVKEGQYGEFYSLDSGQVLMTDKGDQAFGKTDRFFSLPKDKQLLLEIAEGLKKLAESL